LRLLLIVAVCSAAIGSAGVCRLPPISPDFDAIAVFLPGGRMPQIPWEGFPDEARERFWALSCEGMLVQRTAWCAYLVVTPAGSADDFLDAIGMLRTSYTLPDTSVWTRALSLVPADTTGARTVVWAAADSFTGAGPLPLRRSCWLAAGPDTLVISGPWDDNLFLWLPEETDAGSCDAAWRGSGTELLPAGSRSFRVEVATTSTGTPANMASYPLATHAWDSVFDDPWGRIFAAVDSLVAEQFPESTMHGGLVWLRSAGSSRDITPWEMLPGPAAPARARRAVAWPFELPSAPPSGRPPDAPEVHPVRLPCPGQTADQLAVLASVLERVLARSALPGIAGAGAIQVFPVSDGFDVILIGDLGVPDSSLLSTIRSLVSTTALCPPESALVANATLRASIREGRWLPMPVPSDVVKCLGRALGLTADDAL